MRPATLTIPTFLIALLSVVGSTKAATATIELNMRASGTLSNAVDVTSPVDDAHLCAAFSSLGGIRSYMLRYAASPTTTLLDPSSPALVMTFSNPESVSNQLASHDGSIQVALGGRRFFGSSQPGAAFQLKLSLQPNNAGGDFSARHLVDESGQQAIDIIGKWQCIPPASEKITVRSSATERNPSSGADAPAARITAAPPPTAPTITQSASFPVSLPPVAPSVSAPAAVVSSPPPPTTGNAPFRQLLENLGHDAAVPSNTASVTERHASNRNELFTERRVFIHYRQGSATGQMMADRLARQLFLDFAHTEIRTVSATPGIAEVRYFFLADAAAAHALADTLGSTDGQWQVRSFTNYQPSPMPGTLELWVPAR